MVIKLGLIGASGRFGHAIGKLADRDSEFAVTGRFGREDSLEQNGIDLYIDASLPEALQCNLKAALKTKRPIVIGVTGLSDEQILSIKKASEQIPVFYAPNFSLGMAVLRKLVEQTARLFSPEAEIDIIETHHVHKKDAPSGAAKLLATTVEQHHANKKKPSIHSLRLGLTIGKHEVQFNCLEEQITLTHTAHHREVFAKGALAAARFLSTQTPGFYTMSDLCTESL